MPGPIADHQSPLVSGMCSILEPTGQFAASFDGVMADAGVEVVKISRAVRSFCLAVLVSSAATAGSPSLSPDVVLIVGGGRGRRRPTAR
jgi:hypothetical protein